MNTSPRTILFAGGGSGGHIYPNLAVLERLREVDPGVTAHLLISNRPVDEQIVRKEQLPFTALPALPLVFKPKPLWAFYQAYKQSELVTLDVIAKTNASAMIATGGFVSGPAVSAAQKAGIPVALLNLDAVPGRANRFIANKTTEAFTTYSTPQLRRAQRIGMPLRHSAIGTLKPEKARWDLGPAPRPRHDPGLRRVSGVNVDQRDDDGALHARPTPQGTGKLAGDPPDRTQRSRRWCSGPMTRPGCGGWPTAFCHKMGAVWSAATVAIGRAGAGSVAEAWVNAVPTIFMPYPYHKDQHQRLNAEPLVSSRAQRCCNETWSTRSRTSTRSPARSRLSWPTRRGLRRCVRSCVTPARRMAPRWWRTG